MIHHRSKDEVFRFDVGKLIVLLLLLALLFFLTLCRGQQTLAAPSLTDPTADSVLASGPVTLAGTGEAGSTVQILADGAVVGTAVVGEDGSWSFDTDLVAGETEFTFATLDSDGTAVASSEPIRFTVADLVAAESGAVEMETPTLDLPETAVNPGTFTLSGSGTPGSLVEIMQNGVSLGTAEVGSDGTWAFDLDLPDAGEFDFVINGLDADGNIVASSAPQTLSVAGLDIAAPTFDLPDFPMIGPWTLTGSGTPGSLVEIIQNGISLGTAEVGDDGSWSFDLNWPNAGDYELSLNALDAAGNVVAATDSQRFNVGSIDITAPSFELPDLPTVGAFTLTGVGTPGSLVEIIQNGVSLGTAEVGDDGSWSFDLDWPNAGDYELSLNALDADGNVVASSDSQTFTVGGLEIAAPTLELPDFATGAPFTLSGSGTPGSTIEVYANGELVGTTTVDADGNWSLADLGDLAAGSYDFSLRSLGADGELLAESDPIALDIPDGATAAGPAPTLTALRSGITEAEMVMLSGTAVPGSTVEIIIGGEVVDTVTADAGGNWRSSFQLPAGGYTIVARSDDANSTPLAFVVANAATAGTLQVSYATAEATSSNESSATSSLTAQLPTVELILDASWSMTQPLNGTARIDIARETMIDIVSNVIPNNAPVALRIYGNIEGDYACRTDLMVPLGPLNQAEMTTTINDVTPMFNANTPIAASLAEVPNDLSEAEGEIIVVLLTDGEETCEGDPAAAISALVAQGIDVRVDIVGFDIADDALQAEFQRWAELGGGQYYNAANTEELVGALSQSLGVSYLVQNEAGEGIAVGIIGGPALSLPPGSYTLQLIAAPDVELEPVTIGEGETVEVTLE